VFHLGLSAVMPWKTRSLLEARRRFVQAVLRATHSMAELCRQANVSQKTGFKWWRRFRAEGGPGLRDRSRRPHRSPTRTPTRWLDAVRRVRQRHPPWGGKKIYAWLRRRHPRARLPRPRTITDWLQRWGLGRRSARRARRGPPCPRPALTVPQRPNQVWTVDFKGWFRTGDGQRVDPLTVRDLFSRYLLGIRLLRHRHQRVHRYFQRLFCTLRPAGDHSGRSRATLCRRRSPGLVSPVGLVGELGHPGRIHGPSPAARQRGA
jgi:transposase-like protein